MMGKSQLSEKSDASNIMLVPLHAMQNMLAIYIFGYFWTCKIFSTCIMGIYHYL